MDVILLMLRWVGKNERTEIGTEWKIGVKIIGSVGFYVMRLRGLWRKQGGRGLSVYTNLAGLISSLIGVEWNVGTNESL